jgi:hypothetical protein
MQYTPTHSCGHKGETMKLYGPERDRKRALEAAARHQCPECRVAAAHATADAQGWPRLTGSAKQIAYAHDLRIMAQAVWPDADFTQALPVYLASWWIEQATAIKSGTLAATGRRNPSAAVSA